jgi:protein gp37
MGATSIEWTDVSWPVLNGCRRASPGCQNCYAERLSATRLRNHPKYKGLAIYQENGPRWTGTSRLWRPDLTMPLRLKAPKRIFVCDMGDLFYEGNSDADIDAIFGVMWACLYLGRRAIPGHTFQVLTKRAKRMRDYLASDRREQWARAAVTYGGEFDPDGVFDQTMRLGKEPHPRIWLGVSCESQEWADERIPHLLATPAAVRFVSAEPLLGPIDLSPYLTRCCDRGTPALPGDTKCSDECCPGSTTHFVHGGALRPAIDWVIVGGESGPGARPCDVAWVRSIVDHCKAAGVAAFVKQLGAEPAFRVGGAPWFHSYHHAVGELFVKRLKDRKGGDPGEWPDGLNVRQFPEARP